MIETDSDYEGTGTDGTGRVERMTRDLESLSRPRRTGSAGERETIEFLEESFSSIDLPLSRQEFTFSACPVTVGARLIPLVIWIVLLTAMAIRPVSVGGSLALFILLLIASVPGTRWNGIVERLYDLRLSVKKATNLVASLQPGEVRGRLVLMAHHDSKSQTLPLFMRLSLHTVFFVGVAGVAGLQIAFSLAGAGDWVLYLWFPTLLLGIPLFLVLVNRSRNGSPGAVDNASGLAILLEVARNLKREKMEGIEVVFLLTGAEEEGLAGAIRFARTMKGAYHPHSTYVVNLDGVGSPGGIVLSSRHSFPPVRTGGRLETILVKIAAEMEIPIRKIYFPISPGLDHIPISHKGYRSVTLTSSDFDPATLSIHTGRDAPKNVDPAVMSDCVSLLLKLAKELDEGVSAP